jgi:hypothetical protein
VSSLDDALPRGVHPGNIARPEGRFRGAPGGLVRGGGSE